MEINWGYLNHDTTSTITGTYTFTGTVRRRTANVGDLYIDESTNNLMVYAVNGWNMMTAEYTRPRMDTVTEHYVKEKGYIPQSKPRIASPFDIFYVFAEVQKSKERGYLIIRGDQHLQVFGEYMNWCQRFNYPYLFVDEVYKTGVTLGLNSRQQSLHSKRFKKEIYNQILDRLENLTTIHHQSYVVENGPSIQFTITGIPYVTAICLAEELVRIYRNDENIELC